jgi:cytochrome c biogenesis protein
MTATKNNKAEGRPVSGISRTFRFLVSVRLAIIVLSLIAATSIVGSLIQQGASEEEYLSLYSERAYHFIKLFGLDDAYHSPWFYLLLGIFALNLLLCTIQRLKRTMAPTQRQVPDLGGLVSSGSGFVTAPGNKEEVIRRIPPSYRRLALSGTAEVFEKGRISRWGVIIIHTSVLLMLAGGLIGNVSGFKAYLALRPGEEAEAVVSRKPGQAAVMLGFTVKCTDFRMSLYPSGQPKEYASDIEILDKGGNVLKRGRIRVNEPLSYKGIYFYQSSYGRSNTYTFTEDGKTFELTDGEVARDAKVPFMVVRYAEDVHNFGPGVMVAYMDSDLPKTLWFLTNVEKMRSHPVKGSRISLVKISGQYHTGLEVARDPGVPVVLCGFMLMLVGLYINFFTIHRRIYVRDGPDALIVAGTASRNRENFKAEIEKLGGGLP